MQKSLLQLDVVMSGDNAITGGQPNCLGDTVVECLEMKTVVHLFLSSWNGIEKFFIHTPPIRKKEFSLSRNISSLFFFLK